MWRPCSLVEIQIVPRFLGREAAEDRDEPRYDGVCEGCSGRLYEG